MTASLALASTNRVLGTLSEKRPNVIFVICDQMRADAMGIVGHPVAKTPNLDKMAKEGVLFENAFSNNPVCAPARVTCFTGRLPHQHGQLTNKSGKPITNLDNTLLGYFKDKGYRLGWFGKNHTLQKDLFQQLDEAELIGREDFRAYSKYVPPFWHSDTLWPEKECNPRKNTDNAIKFIESIPTEKPFFMHVSYFDPHPPYMAPSEFSSQYNASDMVLPEYINPPAPRIKEQQKALHYDQMSESDLRETMRYYYAGIEWGVDYQVGRLLDAVKKNGQAENTIIVFTSDHGDFMGEFNMVRKGMFLYDALLHIPFIVWAPGKIKPGLRTNTLAQHADIFPTLVDMTEGKGPDDLPGRSLQKVLKGEMNDGPDYAIIASAQYSDLPDGYWDDPELAFDPDSERPFHSRVEDLTWKPKKNTVMARTREWKLIKSETRPTELYHMKDGFQEQVNVAGLPQYSKIQKHLEEKIKTSWPWWTTNRALD
jgi:arylsulfatase